MSSPTDIKQVLLTGTAASEMSGGTDKREKRAKRGGDVRKRVISPPVPSSVPSPVPLPVPVPVTVPVPVITEGGTKIIKVELKKRTTAKRVQLQPKRTDAPKVAKKPHMVSQTKRARKVTLAVGALHKRIKRAKKMTRKVKEMSLDQLREHLVQKKLIKPTSKAPEPVLRQIAADAQIVAGKAL